VADPPLVPAKVRLAQADWDAYVAANDAFAHAALDLAAPGATIWVHDYHLLLLAQALRRRGHDGPIGLFLYVPFCASDMFSILPWAEDEPSHRQKGVLTVLSESACARSS